MEKYPVILVDDNEIFREGLRMLINTSERAEVIAEGADGEELLKLLPQYQEAIVLMDRDMPGVDGIDATEEVSNQFPAVRVIILTMFASAKTFIRMIKAGTQGFIRKDADISEVIQAIETVAGSNYFFAQDLLASMIRKLKQKKPYINSATPILTKTQLKILPLLMDRLPNEEIASKLQIDSKEIEKQSNHLMEKANANTPGELVIWSVKNDIIKI